MATASATAKIWYLKQINLFKGISMEEMEQVAKMVVEKTFRRKEKVYLPGEPGQSIYLIKKGVVKISKITPDGRGLTLAFLKPGEIFGEKESWMFPVKPLWLKTPKLSKLFPHR
ncbi:MAG: cyclic nucleotide-binding domain-containing protein, partial [Candidatus Omnitrophica bacterium]|nr:cyclic nucleotide-binding domain-containing protein [Candidatus Omnitrophota bacterium]